MSPYSADVGIMAIPIPLLWKAQIPLHRKLSLGVFFASGIFIILTILLRTFYSLRSLTDLLIATQWATREYLVTAIVVSAPAIKPLFSRRLWGLKTSGNRSGAGYHYGDYQVSHGSRVGNSKADGHSTVVESRARGDQFEMHWSRKGGPQKIRLPSEASQEHIVGYPGSPDEEAGIHVTESYHVSSSDRKDKL